MALRQAQATLAVRDNTLALVASLIIAGPICTRCLAFRVDRSDVEMDKILGRIAKTLTFRIDGGRCQRCLREKVVHRL